MLRRWARSSLFHVRAVDPIAPIARMLRRRQGSRPVDWPFFVRVSDGSKEADR